MGATNEGAVSLTRSKWLSVCQESAVVVERDSVDLLFQIQGETIDLVLGSVPVSCCLDPITLELFVDVLDLSFDPSFSLLRLIDFLGKLT